MKDWMKDQNMCKYFPHKEEEMWLVCERKEWVKWSGGCDSVHSNKRKMLGIDRVNVSRN